MFDSDFLFSKVEEVQTLSGEEACLVGTKKTLQALPIPYQLLENVENGDVGSDAIPVVWNGVQIFEITDAECYFNTKGTLYIVPISQISKTMKDNRNKLIGDKKLKRGG